MSARTVLFLHSSAGRYGADRQLCLIASRLDRARYRPLVVLPQRGELATDLAHAGVEVLIHPLSVIRRELASMRGVASVGGAAARDAVTLARLIRAREISIVHSNTSVALGGAGAAALARVPHVWHVRELYSRFPRAWPAYRALVERANALICISGAVAAQFRPSAPVHVIVDGLAVDPLRAPREEARAALGLPADAEVIALSGRISELKGQEVLVRALADPRLAARGTLGLLAGEPWPGAERRLAGVLELASALGVRERLLLVGFRDDLQNVYGAADLVAVPSTSPEGLGGVAIEAGAAGCAVIAAAHGGLLEVIRDRQNGRLVAPGDPRMLAAVAAELLDDQAERERLGAAAAQDLRARFSPGSLLASVQALYDSLLR